MCVLKTEWLFDNADTRGGSKETDGGQVEEEIWMVSLRSGVCAQFAIELSNAETFNSVLPPLCYDFPGVKLTLHHGGLQSG